MKRWREVNLESLEWEDVKELNDNGIFNVAWHEPHPNPKRNKFWEHAGYNDMLRGDDIEYKNKQYKIVMVSRMGDFGLSDTGDLPYTIRVNPCSCIKLENQEV